MDCTRDFFFIPHWYKYLRQDHMDPATCEITGGFLRDGALDFTMINLIGLGVLDILLRIGILVAVGFVIYGGVQFITSRGEPDKAKRAQGTIINAVIGVAIMVLAAALVSFIGNRIGG